MRIDSIHKWAKESMTGCLTDVEEKFYQEFVNRLEQSLSGGGAPAGDQTRSAPRQDPRTDRRQHIGVSGPSQCSRGTFLRALRARAASISSGEKNEARKSCRNVAW